MSKPSSKKFYVAGGRREGHQVYIKSIPQEGGFVVVGQIVDGVEQEPIFGFTDDEARAIPAPAGVNVRDFRAVMEKAIQHAHKTG